MRALCARGVRMGEDPASADVVIINTCGFIREAKEESLEAIFDVVGRHPDHRLVVMGCLVQRYRSELERDIPEVEAWFGVGELDAVAEHVAAGAAVAGSETATGGMGSLLRGAWGYIKVSDGCDHRCSFCAIPLIKGPYRGEPLASILDQADQVLAEGARELVLVGQDTALWHEDGCSLPELVERLAEDPRVARVRLMYLQPEHVDERLLEVVAGHPRVCRYLDMPFQHASRAVLRRMRRWGDAHDYLDLIEKARARMPDVSLRSTFIVGFPGETEDDFQQLLDFVTEADLDHAGAFAFSAEEGTAAAVLEPRVPPRVTRTRLARLTSALLDVGELRTVGRIGSNVEVLVDGPAPPDAPEGIVAVGRTEGQAPEVDGVTYLLGPRMPVRGEVVVAEVVDAAGFDLFAEMS